MYIRKLGNIVFMAISAAMFEKTFGKIENARLGEMLVRKGLITQAELDQALALQHDRNIKLGELLVEKNLIPPDQLDKTLKEQQILLGQLLIEDKLINQDELDQALALQQGSQKKLGEVLVENNLISQDQLENYLEKQYWQKNGFWLIDPTTENSRLPDFCVVID